MSTLDLKQQLNALPKAIWVRMYRNRLQILDHAGTVLHTHIPMQKYDHPRSILNEFHHAESAFQQLLTTHPLPWYDKSPLVLLQIPEKFEGGLSFVEVRALREMAYNAGARQVMIYDHNGECLNPEDTRVNQQTLHPISRLIIVLAIMFVILMMYWMNNA